jgi:hypothetical protein
MILRLLATSLTTVLLLAGSLGCSKKDDPASPPMNTGSYMLDGKTIMCTVEATRFIYNGNGPLYENLALALTTTPQPASGRQLLQLVYKKTSPTSPYELDATYLLEKGSQFSSCDFSSTAATATLTSDGSCSGTFAGKADSRSLNPEGYKEITAGTFANVRL